MSLTFRQARIEDLKTIIQLLNDDKLGKTRESAGIQVDDCYIKAFEKILEDSNQYLMVAVQDNDIIGTCHLTIMPSLTFKGSTRMQIEAVRIANNLRGQGLGEKMMTEALQFAQDNQVKIVQLTTNKLRDDAKKFYERLGFSASHEGMKLFLSN